MKAERRYAIGITEPAGDSFLLLRRDHRLLLDFDRRLFENVGIATSLYPFLKNRYWYIACYVLLFVLLPYINILLKNLTDRQFDVFVILLFVVKSVLPVSQKQDFFRMDWGYSSAWLIVCYILGVYIKRRPGNWSLQKQIALAAAVSGVFFGYTALRFCYWGEASAFSWATEYVSPGIVVLSMLLVAIFSKITLENSRCTKRLQESAQRHLMCISCTTMS